MVTSTTLSTYQWHKKNVEQIGLIRRYRKNINDNVKLKDLQCLLAEFYLSSASSNKTCYHFKAGVSGLYSLIRGLLLL